MNIIYDSSTGAISAVGSDITGGVTLTNSLPGDFVKYFALGKYLARAVSGGAEVYENTAWTYPLGGSDDTTAYVGHSLYVDQVYGNDSTAVVGNEHLPFSTLSGARDASQEYDTIYVNAGSYTGSDLLRPHVNWVFRGCTVTNPTAVAIFDNGVNGFNDSVESRISGDVELVCTSENATAMAFNLSRNDSDVHASVTSITSVATAVNALGGYVHAEKVNVSGTSPAFTLAGTANVSVGTATAPYLFTLTDSASLHMDNGTATTTTTEASSILAGNGTAQLTGRISCASSVVSITATPGVSLRAKVTTSTAPSSDVESMLVSGYLGIDE